MSSERSILVTGASGFLGRYVLREMLRDDPGLRIHVLVRSAAARARILAFFARHGERPVLSFVTGDLTRRGLGLTPVAAAALRDEITEVWHVAAITNLESQDLALLYGTNVRGTARLLSFARQLPRLVRFHYVSTAYAVGRQRAAIREQAAEGLPSFRNLYERSKFAAERLVRRSGLPAVIYRPSIIVGDSVTGDNGDDCQTVYRFVQAVVVGVSRARSETRSAARSHGSPQAQTFRIPGSADTALNFVCVDEVARLMVTLSQRAEAGQVLNLTNLRDLTGDEVRGALDGALDLHGIGWLGAKTDNLSRGEKTTLWLARPFLPYVNEPGPVWETARGRDLTGGGWMPAMTAEKFTQLMQAYFAAEARAA